MKAEPSTNSTVRGITIDSSFECENARDSIRFNDDGDSNEIEESDLHSKKQESPRTSTWHGIAIDLTFERANARNSIRFNDDGDSNEIDRTGLLSESHRSQTISTEDGIQTVVIGKSLSYSIVSIRSPFTTSNRRMQPLHLASDIFSMI
jgi:hypothetical protein